MAVNKLRLVDGTTFDIVGGCYGGKEYFRDTLRDCLEFRLSVNDLSLDQADSIFSAENCALLIIIEEELIEVPVSNEVGRVDEEGNPVLDEEGNQIIDVVSGFETQIKVNEYNHEGYVVRVNLSKREETILLADDKTDVQTFICIKMGQESDAEKLQVELDATNAAYDDLVLEFLGV